MAKYKKSYPFTKKPFVYKLANERKEAVEEQIASFQEGLSNERKAVAEEQEFFTKQQLADEKKTKAN